MRIYKMFYKNSSYKFIFALVLGMMLAVGVSVWATSVGQDVSVSGTLSAGGTLTITGASTFTGAVTANGNATFGDAAGDTFTITGNSITYSNAGTTTIPSASAAAWAYATSSASIPFLRFDTSNYRIGISTTTPGATFSVGGAGNIYALGGIGAGLATTTAGALETSGAGLVGGAFNVTGVTQLNGNLIVGDAAADTLTITSNSITHSNISTTTIPNTNANSFAYATSSSAGPAFIKFDTANVFTGIATNTPSATLDIGGDGSVAITAATGTATSSLRMQSRGTTRGACIELESADGTNLFRLYATNTTNTNQGGIGYAPAVFELGSCR